jgi:dienelactone hydrolase
MGYATLSRPRLYQGLLLVNSALRQRDLPPNLDAAKGMPVTLIHGARDPGVPLAHAKSVMEALEAAGLDANLEVVDTAEHRAPLGDKGAPAIEKFLKSLGTEPVKGREIPVAPERIETESADGLKLTADLYETGDRSDPIILLFHQARSSRGEYREIAPRLVEAGYNCLALDQRSGKEWLGVVNETAKRAADQGKPQNYHDAKPDLLRAAAWARELGFKGRLAILGSSYSAALVVILGSEIEGVDAVIAFSPGDYVQPRGSVFEGAKKLKAPTLIVCPLNEKPQAEPIHDALGNDEADFHAFPRAVHGASMLYRSAQAEEIWRKLLQFLEGTLKKEKR